METHSGAHRGETGQNLLLSICENMVINVLILLNAVKTHLYELHALYSMTKLYIRCCYHVNMYCTLDLSIL